MTNTRYLSIDIKMRREVEQYLNKKHPHIKYEPYWGLDQTFYLKFKNKKDAKYIENELAEDGYLPEWHKKMYA